MRRPSAPPAARLLGALALALLVTVGATAAALRLTPWLGATPARTADGQSLRLGAVDPAGPAAGAGVRVGDSLVALARGDGGGPVVLEGLDLLEEPDFLDTWAETDRFYARQSALHALLAAGDVALTVADARGARRTVRLAPAARPLHDLPHTFWLQLAFGVAGCVIGAWVWALRPGEAGTRAYAVTGLCFLVFASAAAIYSARELALPMPAFRALAMTNHLGAIVFGAALCALFLTYPRRLVSGRVAAALGGIALLWWLGDVLRWWPDQDLASRLPVMAAMLGAIVIAGVQWWRARGEPAARAVLRWFAASVLVGCGLFVGLVYGATALGHQPVIPQAYAFGFFLLMYAGIAVGMRRYRLFDLDEWALRILFWAAALASFVLVDALLLGTAGLGSGRTFAVIALLGVLTLPVRDFVWRRVLRREPVAPVTVVERALAVAYAPSDDERATRWRALLGEFYEPLAIEPADDDATTVARDATGESLVIPAVASAPALRLVHAGGGRRLFGAGDARLATTLASLMRTADASRAAFEAGVRRERTRIARDLHDTVSSPLLAGLAPAAGQVDAADDAARARVAAMQEEIRRAVGAMRTVVTDAGAPAPLAEVVADARYAAVERLRAKGIDVAWPIASVGDHVLDAERRAALEAFVREATSNVLRHARASRVEGSVAIERGVLTLRIADDGVGIPVDLARTGDGLPNLHARAATLGGMARIAPRHDGRGTEVVLVAPLPDVRSVA